MIYLIMKNKIFGDGIEFLVHFFLLIAYWLLERFTSIWDFTDILKFYFLEKIWVFPTKINVQISIFWQSYGVNLWFFKFRTFYITEFVVWNIRVCDKNSYPLLLSSAKGLNYKNFLLFLLFINSKESRLYKTFVENNHFLR